jgi:hypothetical protein
LQKDFQMSNPTIVQKDFLMAFRAYDTEEVQAKDEAGNLKFADNGEPVMVKVKVKTRENFTVSAPVPTAEGIVAALQGPNLALRDLLVSHVHSLIAAQLRAQVDAEVNPANSADEIDYAKLDLAAIAAMKPEERSSAKFKFTDELKALFSDTFVSVMSTAGLLASERGVKVAEAFCKLYAGFRSNDKALERFQQRLAEFTELLNAEQLEELSQVLEHLDSTAVKYLAAINANLDDILGS